MPGVIHVTAITPGAEPFGSEFALDQLVQLSVKDRNVSAPPADPVEGWRYLVPVDATGDWDDRDNTITVFREGGWIFLAPVEGWRVWLANEKLWLVFDGTNWLTDYAILPFFRRRVMQVVPNAGAATITRVGLAADPTIDGSTVSNGDDSLGCWLLHITAASAGTFGGVFSDAVLRGDWSPIYTTRIQTHSSIANVRHWIGLFSADPTGSSDPTTSHLAAFRYATDVDGTAFWRTYTSDGSASTVKTTTAPIAVSTAYNLMVVWMTGAVEFYVDQVLVSRHTTNLPSGSQTLRGGNRVTALTGTARRLRWGHIAMMHN